jgi:hypothetical protein
MALYLHHSIIQQLNLNTVAKLDGFIDSSSAADSPVGVVLAMSVMT